VREIGPHRGPVVWMLGDGADEPRSGLLRVGQMEVGFPPLKAAKLSMDLTQVLAFSVIAVALLLLLRCCRSRSPIDSHPEQAMDRRLQELRDEYITLPTLRRIAEEIRLIVNRGTEPLCLPAPRSGSRADRL
jgi:hypothetical protein